MSVLIQDEEEAEEKGQEAEEPPKGMNLLDSGPTPSNSSAEEEEEEDEVEDDSDIDEDYKPEGGDDVTNEQTDRDSDGPDELIRVSESESSSSEEEGKCVCVLVIVHVSLRVCVYVLTQLRMCPYDSVCMSSRNCVCVLTS